MSRFTETPLILMPYTEFKRVTGVPVEREDKNRWVVMNPIVFEVGEVGSGITISPPVGSLSDLASIPSPLLFWTNRYGPWAAAAVLHDFAYSCHCFNDDTPATQRDCDEMFLDAMLVSGVRKSRAWVMYAAVRLFGWRAYRKSYNSAVVVDLRGAGLALP